MTLLSGLKSRLDSANAEIYSNWSVATPWTPEIRYRPKGSVSEDEAEEMLDAVRDKPDGVLRWIMRYW